MLEAMGANIVNGTRPFMKPEFRSRPFDVVFANSSEFQALAIEDKDRDYVLITRGCIELIFGCMSLLMSDPRLLPEVGNITEDARQPVPRVTAIPRMPLLRRDWNNEDDSVYMVASSDRKRHAFSMNLAWSALYFLLYHEIGHLIAGHSRLPSGNPPFFAVHRERTIQVLECDADTFALSFGAYQHTDMTLKWPGTTTWNAEPGECSFVAMAVAVAALFRLVELEDGKGLPPDPIDCESHPHPAVRTNVALIRLIELMVQAGQIKREDERRLIGMSAQKVYEIWDTRQLPGTRIGKESIWSERVLAQSKDLIERYEKAQSSLSQFARVKPSWYGPWPREPFAPKTQPSE